MYPTLDTSPAVPIPGENLPRKIILLATHHLKTLVLVLMFAAIGIGLFVWWNRQEGAETYNTDKISRGAVEVTVAATGTVQAVTTVQVGSQVSGTVSWLGADFKSRVKRGQVIAKLDPALFDAQVDIPRANLINAQAGVQAALKEIQNQLANVEAAKSNDLANQAQKDDAVSIAKEDEQLHGVIPEREIQAARNAARMALARRSEATSQITQAQAEVRIAQAKLKQAQAVVAQATAQLEQAQIGREHSVITSPIDGVVISRSVDVGQTVAAGLTAPTLFTIANDLTNMQVLASIDEADVGQVREGGPASFTVDAYPGRRFTGTINQLRLNAQTLQNVVTYTAVISVANPDEALLPGMTTSITMVVARSENILRVPNAALRFKPELTEQQQKELNEKIRTLSAGQPVPGAKSEQQPGTNKTPASGASAHQTIWLLTAKKTLEPHFIQTGITDGRVTEIVSGEVKEGDTVVLGQSVAGSSNSNRTQPASSTGAGQRTPGSSTQRAR
jgi:HlyD family secretion protein